MQAPFPIPIEYVPCEHSWQPLASPATAHLPAGQTVPQSEEALGPPAGCVLPAAQSAHTFAPAAEYRPIAQSRQTSFAAPEENLPTGHGQLNVLPVLAEVQTLPEAKAGQAQVPGPAFKIP